MGDRAAPAVSGESAPLAFLVDYDGTIAETQLTDELLLQHAASDAWRAMDEAYLAGRAGSRDQLVSFVGMLTLDEAAAYQAAGLDRGEVAPTASGVGAAVARSPSVPGAPGL